MVGSRRHYSYVPRLSKQACINKQMHKTTPVHVQGNDGQSWWFVKMGARRQAWQRFGKLFFSTRCQHAQGSVWNWTSHWGRMSRGIVFVEAVCMRLHCHPVQSASYHIHPCLNQGRFRQRKSIFFLQAKPWNLCSGRIPGSNSVCSNRGLPRGVFSVRSHACS